jgi:hypothetical protein
MFKEIEKPAACEMQSVIRFLNTGNENVHDDSWSGRPAVVNEALVRAVQENRQFTISSLSLHFPQISWSFLS